MNDDFIELGLRGRLATADACLPLSTAINKLLGLLRDFVAVLDLGDRGELRDRIEACRQAVISADSVPLIVELSEHCVTACQSVPAQFESLRLKQKREIASLVDVVRDSAATSSRSWQET